MSGSTRRAPLASIPNATNSPHRFLATSGSKRPRSLANISQQEDDPPQKRQMVQKTSVNVGPATPRRNVQGAEGRVFERGDGTVDNAFQRKLVAAREKATANTKAGKHAGEGHSTKDVESIRQWQKHTRRIFPSFNFYFESIPDETRTRFARQVTSLGAGEEKFFSKSVTHIVTTRQIPLDIELLKSPESTSSGRPESGDGQLQTINPSLLEKNANLLAGGVRGQAVGPSGISIRRDGTGSMDVLTRGRQMGMKIWTADKFQRVMASLLDDSNMHAHNTRGSHAVGHGHRGQRDDLSQVLRNERIGASSERELASLTRDLVLFKGPFIYVHDMDAKVRPTMIREYSKVARRQDGEWPQFRSAPIGKCPFVEDMLTRKEIEQERAREKALYMQQQMEAQQIARTRTSAVAEQAKMEPPCRRSPRKALQEIRNFTAGPVPVSATAPSKNPLPSKLDRQSSVPSMPERIPASFMRPPHMTQFGREPAASGIQRSNMTSAIQSQMISSTAAAPGAKAGTSKEVHELKRKVLERGHTASLSVGSMPSSHRMTDLAGVLQNSRAPAPQRAAKSRAQEKLGGIQEETDANGDERTEKPAPVASRRKKPARRDPKPGYCENCRDKYDDFEEHVVSRKHRKFAMTQSNWIELDELLAQLQEP